MMTMIRKDLTGHHRHVLKLILQFYLIVITPVNAGEVREYLAS
jgi:hypothetical protein